MTQGTVMQIWILKNMAEFSFPRPDCPFSSLDDFVLLDTSTILCRRGY